MEGSPAIATPALLPKLGNKLWFSAQPPPDALARCEARLDVQKAAIRNVELGSLPIGITSAGEFNKAVEAANTSARTEETEETESEDMAVTVPQVGEN